MKKLGILVGVLAVVSLGCNNNDNTGGGGAAGSGGTAGDGGQGGASGGGGAGGQGGSPSQDVAISFEGVVGPDPFVCGATYDNLGANNSSLELSDFRLYIQNVELKNAAGDYVPVTMTDDDVWQSDGTALIDFEDVAATSARRKSTRRSWARLRPARILESVLRWVSRSM